MSGIRPPSEARRFIELIGEAATLALLRRYGGLRIQVPVHARADGALARAVGLPAAQALVTEYCGTKLTLPLCKRWQILHLRRDGLTYSEIARRLTTSESVVRKALTAARQAAEQMALPGL